MNEHKEIYDLFNKLSEITMISTQFVERIKDYSDTEVATVIMAILDRLGTEYSRDSVGILKSVSEVFPSTFEMLSETMEGGE